MLFPVLHGVLAVVGDDGEVRVYIVVVLSVVFVIGRRYKERVEVDALYAERGEVRNFLFDALQIAAVKVADVEAVRNFVPVVYRPDVTARIVIFIVGNVVAGIAVSEPVGKNLVEHPALSPVGHVETGNERKIIFFLIVCNGAEAVVVDEVVVIGNLKIIADYVVGAGKFEPVKIESFVCLFLFGHFAQAAAETHVNL